MQMFALTLFRGFGLLCSIKLPFLQAVASQKMVEQR